MFSLQHCQSNSNATWDQWPRKVTARMGLGLCLCPHQAQPAALVEGRTGIHAQDSTPGDPKVRDHVTTGEAAKKIQGPFRKLLPQAATQSASPSRDSEAVESPSNLQTTEAAGSTRDSGGKCFPGIASPQQAATSGANRAWDSRGPWNNCVPSWGRQSP